MPNKPYSVKPGDVDNLFTVIFTNAQDKEHRYLTFSGTGVWPAASLVAEKEVVFCYNSTDNVYRLYTKIAGTLRYVQLT